MEMRAGHGGGDGRRLRTRDEGSRVQRDGGGSGRGRGISVGPTRLARTTYFMGQGLNSRTKRVLAVVLREDEKVFLALV
jgi:hypothetical protein